MRTVKACTSQVILPFVHYTSIKSYEPDPVEVVSRYTYNLRLKNTIWGLVHVANDAQGRPVHSVNCGQ